MMDRSLQSRLKDMSEALKNKVAGWFVCMAELARDDPRRVIHSFKVGVALTFVSLFYYFKPLYDDLGVSAMWAVMTVVVVSEFSVGATLGKGLNRGMATLTAGALGIGAHHIANQFGAVGEPILIGIFVFLLAAVATFVRFIPKVKARYDYGLLIFILTFSFVSVSGYRDDKILELARKRLSTVMIGASVSVTVSMALFPVWAGEDLHDLVALNLERLGNFMEGFGDEYFGETELKTEDLRPSSMREYRTILTSKNSEESLANFARWEPCHGRFKFKHPWKLYLQIGTLTRQCAYNLEALNRYLAADIMPTTEIRSKIEGPSREMSRECGRALKQMSQAIKSMREPSTTADPHIESAKSSVKALNSLLKSNIWKEGEEEGGRIDLLRVAPVATVASLLIDVVDCVEMIGYAASELASKAEFERVNRVSSAPSMEKLHQRGVRGSNLDGEAGCGHVVITVKESAGAAATVGNEGHALCSPKGVRI